MPVKIPDAVRDTLRVAEKNGSQLKLVGQLDRKAYKSTNKVIEALGGKWNRKAKVHLFEDDDSLGKLEEAINLGVYTDAKKDFGFFETPSALAEEMAYWVCHGGRVRVLEPSAGNGAIARKLFLLADTGHVIDIRPQCESVLTPFDTKFQFHCRDFLGVAACEFAPFDAIAMNPPFGNLQELDHIQHAWTFLGKGGRLAAIAASSWTFRSTKKAVVFRQWVDSVGAAYRELPSGTFDDTGVVSTLIQAEKR